MVKIDLITGFLGSGKTTFIKKYVGYLVKQGYNVGILENDYGAVNVDMMLLQDIMGDNCHAEMVAGGCDEDCHRRRFKTKLIAMGMSGYDRVIVEPSGIFDVDEFFDVLCEEPLDRWYEIGSVISIVEAEIDRDMSRQSRYVLASEVASCGIMVMSKTKEASPDAIQSTIDFVNSALEEFQCSRRFDSDVCTKCWDELTDEDFDVIRTAGCMNSNYVKLWFKQSEVYGTVYIMNKSMPAEQLEACIKGIFSDRACGDVFRIKGFVKMDDGSFLEVNATRRKIDISPIANGQEIIIVIGSGINEDRIKGYFDHEA